MALQTREYHKRWRDAHRERIHQYYLRDYEKRKDALKRKRSTPEYRSRMSTYLKAWRKEHHAQHTKSVAEWHRAHRDYLKGYRKTYAARRRELYQKNRVRICARKREQAKTPKYRLAIRTRFRRYRMTNPQFVLADRLRIVMRRAIHRQFTRKSARTFDLIGCSPSELRDHIERLFLPGMSWENRNLWHVDHKRPLALFDLTDPEQQREAFHFTNLQPLWAKDNQSKGARA